MNVQRDLERLKNFYGAVASDQNRFILKWVTGERMVELGCGYGTFVEEARKKGKEAFGLDIDFKILETGQWATPLLRGRLVQGDIAHLPFKEKSFHSVILRESLHHVNWRVLFPEILRVCKKEIIIFEPNPNWPVRCCRRIISHKDQEVPVKPLLRLLVEHHVVVQGVYFRDFIAFPLSGGFVGWEFIPPVKILFPVLVWVDRLLRNFFHLLKLDGVTCWRYLVKGSLKG